ncbi:anti-sigma factor family protein [Streptomyces uncialis]|uniref:anti-sigma factor family protein n=1 Tax=Streptomyces uncialis TaxID=1048205 RepID=UPI0036620148
MSPQARHQDVAAYALGVLEPADASRFEEHLDECVACMVRLGDLSRVVTLLAPFEGPRAEERPPLERPSGELLDRLLTEVGARHTRRRTLRMRLIGAAAALVLGAPLAAYTLGGHGPDAPHPPVAGAPVVQSLRGTDPLSGARASVRLTDRRWGTEVALSLARVQGPLVCALIAVGRDGTRQTVATWAVPPPGGRDVLGAVDRRDAPVISGGTALPRADIARFEIRTRDGRLLMTVNP